MLSIMCSIRMSRRYTRSRISKFTTWICRIRRRYVASWKEQERILSSATWLCKRRRTPSGSRWKSKEAIQFSLKMRWPATLTSRLCRSTSKAREQTLTVMARGWWSRKASHCPAISSCHGCRTSISTHIRLIRTTRRSFRQIWKRFIRIFTNSCIKVILVHRLHAQANRPIAR